MGEKKNGVSVVVDRTVLPGKTAEFETCLKNIIWVQQTTMVNLG